MADAAFFTAYENKKKELDKLMKEWEVVQEELDNA
jgi:ATP-binding cassette subfamily F protein 3